MRWRFVPLGLLILGLVLAYAMGWHEHLTLAALVESRATLEAKISARPILAGIWFMLVYMTAVAFAFPAASLLTMAAGFFFGWLAGGTMAVFAATLGATVLFLAARTAFGDVLRQRFGGRAARLAKGFEQDAFGYLLVLRLAPVFPFWMVNIASAFFNVPLRTFMTATVLGIVPATYAYACLGRGLETALLSAAEAGRDVRISDLATKELTLGLTALAAVAVIAILVKRRWARERS